MDKLIAAHIAVHRKRPSALRLPEQLFAPNCDLSALDQYIADVQDVFAELSVPSKGPQIVYTPMHGVGGSTVARLFPELIFCTPQVPPMAEPDFQTFPDPEFRSARFPNPEEGLEALGLAIEQASLLGAPLVFATDPDADRFCVAERKDAAWTLFTGNQIAVMLGMFAWRHRDLLCFCSPSKKADKFAMLASGVSSRMLECIGQQEGFLFKMTAAGFKNIANEALKLEAEGYTVIFAFEEAIGKRSYLMIGIGYMFGTKVLDKDGMSALLACKHLVNELYSSGKALHDYLEGLYKTYGYYEQCNGYYYASNVSGIPGAMEKAVERLKDSSKHRWSEDEGVLKIQLEEAVCVRIRPSGTEPKIKFYSEASCDWDARGSKMRGYTERVLALMDWLLDPTISGFTRKEGSGCSE